MGFGFLRFILANGKYPVDSVLIWCAIQDEVQTMICRGWYPLIWNSCIGLRGVLNGTVNCWLLIFQILTDVQLLMSCNMSVSTQYSQGSLGKLS